MKRLLLVFLTIGMTACFPARDPVPSANGGDQHSDDPAQPGGDPSDSPSSSDDPTRPKGEISGWTCKIYTQDHLDFVNDYDFIFDEKGRVCQHNLHQITYNTDGSVSDLELVQKLEASCDREVLRVLQMMPKWQAGIMNAKPCRTKVCIPIVFNL